jgi:ABC-type branched-subunit amino acid transport system substrate-binding protein
MQLTIIQGKISMNKSCSKTLRSLLPIAYCLLSIASFAQAQEPLRQKVAVFAPLYLDSAFAGGSYRYDKSFPKFLNPGLEFYQGAQWALDSLQKKGAPLEVFIYDSRSGRTSLAQQLNSNELKDVQLFIAHGTSTDVKILASEAQRRKIPFISATFPNDAGITNNPYLVILNSTLRTHCEAIYQYMQK